MQPVVCRVCAPPWIPYGKKQILSQATHLEKRALLEFSSYGDSGSRSDRLPGVMGACGRGGTRIAVNSHTMKKEAEGGTLHAEPLTHTRAFRGGIQRSAELAS